MVWKAYIVHIQQCQLGSHSCHCVPQDTDILIAAVLMMLLYIQYLMLQEPPQLTGEIPVHFMETSSLAHCGINLNCEVTELWVSMLCDLLWESIWILYLFWFF